MPYGDGITFHSATRKTGATRLVVDLGVPIPVAQQLGGWLRPDTLLRIYADANSDDLADAVGQAKVGIAGESGERRVRNAEVVGSIPMPSTKPSDSLGNWRDRCRKARSR